MTYDKINLAMFHVKHCDTYLNNEGIERMAAKFQFESTVITTLASQYDVIIIGSGSSGLISAVQAHESGVKPVVLEKMGKIGGNTTSASSGMDAAETLVQLQHHVVDSFDDFYRETLADGGHGHNRIGSNSIAETVVFGRQAGQQVYRDNMTS